MRKQFWLVLCVALAAVWAYAGVGCSTSDGSKFGSDPDAGEVDAADPDAQEFGDTACQLGCGDGSSTSSPVLISPPAATLTIINGVIQTQAFTATVDGKDVTSAVTWSFDTPLMGDVLSGATFTPTGKVGGVGSLGAQVGKSTGSALITVYVQNTVVSGVSPQQQATLDKPGGGNDPSMKIVYPAPDTFFPLKVLAPEMMWNGAGNADVYKVVYSEKYFTLTEYFAQGTPSRHILDQKLWDGLEASGAGPKSDPVGVSVNRLSGNTAYNAVKTTWHVVQGKLHGSVYYWELPDQCSSGNGRILRIKPDSVVVDEFYKNNGQCWGCHTVSRDGTTLMADDETGSPFPQFTLDLTKNPVSVGNIKTSSGLGGTFSAFNDVGDKILVSNDSSSLSASQKLLQIVDAKTAKVLNANALGNGAVEPAWSPDGKLIAGIGNVSGGGWAFDCSGGDLVVADVNGATVSNKKTVVAQAKVLQGRPAYPSFSPTSDHITFGNPTAGSRTTDQGDLWLTDLKGALQHLKIAGSDGKSFNPVFAPLRAGGYTWIVFVTRRDYGNRMVSTNRQQLWVAAVDDPPGASGDPSHPAFYMRGQEDCAKSENAYYALDPCKKKGQGCESGVDCCSGQCIKQGNAYVCGDPTTVGCSDDGNKCSVDADCCGAPVSKCIDGFCQKPPPQ